MIKHILKFKLFFLSPQTNVCQPAHFYPNNAEHGQQEETHSLWHLHLAEGLIIYITVVGHNFPYMSSDDPGSASLTFSVLQAWHQCSPVCCEQSEHSPRSWSGLPVESYCLLSECWKPERQRLQHHLVFTVSGYTKLRLGAPTKQHVTFASMWEFFWLSTVIMFSLFVCKPTNI